MLGTPLALKFVCHSCEHFGTWLYLTVQNPLDQKSYLFCLCCFVSFVLLLFFVCLFVCFLFGFCFVCLTCLFILVFYLLPCFPICSLASMWVL